MPFTITIRDFERGLRFQRGQFIGVVPPGRYRQLGNLLAPGRESIEVVNILSPRFEHALLEVIAPHPSMADELVTINLSESQRALVWISGRLQGIYGPGFYAFWKNSPAARGLDIQTFDVDRFQFEHPRLQAVLEHKDASRWIEAVDVSSDHDVLLFRNGVFITQLSPGKHAFWKGTGRLLVKSQDRREQSSDIAGQEIMTADKVTLRVNMVVTWRVTDVIKAATVVTDPDQALYREAQLALRAAVGTRSLDQLLADKESVGAEVRAVLVGRAVEFGVTVRGVGLRDIILPGEMKTILNRVIEAEKQAQADIIRRREETAAARSQANTAKLLAENPMLARMKELELLQGVLAGSRATFVFGPGEMTEQLRSLVAREDGPTTPRSN